MQRSPLNAVKSLNSHMEVVESHWSSSISCFFYTNSLWNGLVHNLSCYHITFISAALQLVSNVGTRPEISRDDVRRLNRIQHPTGTYFIDSKWVKHRVKLDGIWTQNAKLSEMSLSNFAVVLKLFCKLGAFTPQLILQDYWYI